MEAVTRTLIVLSLVLLWQCSFSTVYSRPLHPKKHTASPFKHHHSSNKNAIMHPLNPTSLRELAFGSHKAEREILPFPLPPGQKQPTHRHHKPKWGAFNPDVEVEMNPVESTFGPIVEAPAPPPANQDGGDFGPWVPHGTMHPAKDTGPVGVFGGPLKAIGTKTTEDSGFGAWGAFKPIHHTTTEDESLGGNSRSAGGTSKTIHFVAGQPHVVEEPFGPETVGTFLSSSEATDETSDGWFMSVVAFPEPAPEIEESSSSSADIFAGVWGAYRDRKRAGCEKNLEGRSCSSNADCHGCNRTFHCSTNHRCQRV